LLGLGAAFLAASIEEAAPAFAVIIFSLAGFIAIVEQD